MGKKFDEAYLELQTIVKRLEEGNLDLEEAIEEFEKGMILLNVCKKKIELAEQKIQELTEKTE